MKTTARQRCKDRKGEGERERQADKESHMRAVQKAVNSRRRDCVLKRTQAGRDI